MPSIIHLIHAYGLITVASVIGLECIGVPLPGETALLAAAIYAGTKHQLSIVSVILVAGAAATVGRMIGFVLGREYGYWLLLRYGRYLRITEARIKLGQYLFLRHGGKIIIIAQFIPVLRTVAGVFAGANMMPWRSFLWTNVVGSFAWAALYGIGAYWLGRGIERFATPAIIILIVVTVLGFIFVGNFIGRHEAQLAAEAERALPGPLKLP